MFSVIYLSLRGEYASAAMQASALAAGALSILCGEASLTCRSASIVLSIPGAADAIHIASKEVVRFASIMQQDVPIDRRICMACLGLRFSSAADQSEDALAILRLDRRTFSRATSSEKSKLIKKAFRDLQRKYHPDKGGSLEDSLRVKKARDTLLELIKAPNNVP